MKKFEYMYFDLDSYSVGLLDELNKYGQLGWQLTSLDRWVDGAHYSLMMMREII